MVLVAMSRTRQVPDLGPARLFRAWFGILRRPRGGEGLRYQGEAGRPSQSWCILLAAVVIPVSTVALAGSGWAYGSVRVDEG